MDAGLANTTGSGNSALGTYANVGAANLSNATAIGARAFVLANNAIVLGQIIGVNGGTADTSVGIGTTAPLDRLHVSGRIRVSTLGSAGSTNLCHNASSQISVCSSSLRYKTNIRKFGFGTNLVRQLNPIVFDWKDGGMHDLGLGAEEVAEIEPLLVTHNDKGEVEGVKYDRIGVVLINAVKEQQAQIEEQRKIIDELTRSAKEQAASIREQKARLDALTQRLCRNDPTLAACAVQEKKDEK